MVLTDRLGFPDLSTLDLEVELELRLLSVTVEIPERAHRHLAPTAGGLESECVVLWARPAKPDLLPTCLLPVRVGGLVAARRGHLLRNQRSRRREPRRLLVQRVLAQRMGDGEEGPPRLHRL